MNSKVKLFWSATPDREMSIVFYLDKFFSRNNVPKKKLVRQLSKDVTRVILFNHFYSKEQQTIYSEEMFTNFMSVL